MLSLADLVQDVGEEFQLVAKQNGVRLLTRVGDDLKPVRGDIEMIERVLQNLIQNAINHTPAGGSVNVTVAQDAGNVTVSVADTGCGIPNEGLPYIFDRFYKARNAAIANAQGVGLAIAKRIMELRGGMIHAESEINVGTTLTFSLPTTEFKRDFSDAKRLAADTTK